MQPACGGFAPCANAPGLLGGTPGKIAAEIRLPGHDEIGELEEHQGNGKPVSSTMPHKRNPATCENVATFGTSLRCNEAFIPEALWQRERRGAACKVECKALPESCKGIGLAPQIVDRVLERIRCSSWPER